MEDCFDLYKMSDIERVKFAKMKLLKPAKTFWHIVTTHLEHINQLAINHRQS